MPEPGNPQSLNRFMYVLGNPLKYVDPTGMFEEDEIKRFFGLDPEEATWDDVEAFFKEDGALEDLWGFLEILIRAEWGDYVFGKVGLEDGWQDIGKFDLIGHDLLNGLEVAELAKLLGGYDYYGLDYIGEEPDFQTSAYAGYHRWHLERLDWPGAVLDTAGLYCDVHGLIPAGRAVSALDVFLSGSNLVFDFISGVVLRRYGYDVPLVTDEVREDFGLAVAGLVIPVVPDAISLSRNLDKAYYGDAWPWER